MVGSSFANYILTPGSCKYGNHLINPDLDEEDTINPEDEAYEADDPDYSFVRNTAISGKYGILTGGWG